MVENDPKNISWHIVKEYSIHLSDTNTSYTGAQSVCYSRNVAR